MASQPLVDFLDWQTIHEINNNELAEVLARWARIKQVQGWNQPTEVLLPIAWLQFRGRSIVRGAGSEIIDVLWAIARVYPPQNGWFITENDNVCILDWKYPIGYIFSLVLLGKKIWKSLIFIQHRLKLVQCELPDLPRPSATKTRSRMLLVLSRSMTPRWGRGKNFALLTSKHFML